MKSKTNKLLSVLTALCMMCSVISISRTAVFAAGETGNSTVTGGELNTDYKFSDNMNVSY